VSKLAALRRSYLVLGELNVRPSVSYLARIRNNDEHHDEGGVENHEG